MEDMSVAQRARFDRLCDALIREAFVSGEAGIGTLCEKRLHATVKRYLCEDSDCHEVGVQGRRFVADVRVGNEIYEVQTGSFFPMKQKIAYYLEQTDCTVTVVHPIVQTAWTSWIDPETLSFSPRRKSPRHGRVEDLLPEMYYLLPYLGHERLRFRVLLIEAQDFRWLDGKRSKDRKRGSRRYERIPLSLVEDIPLETPADFARFLPPALPSHFTVRDFSEATRIRGRDAYSAVRVLTALGLLSEGEKIGRSMGWERV